MPLRAAAGLAAVAIDSARRLPQQLVGLPVLAVSTALQASLKAQQRYAELVVRGDQLLGQLRGPEDGTPAWARFDDEPDAAESAGGSRPRSAFDAAPDPEPDLVEELLDEEAAEVLGTGEAVLDSMADAEARLDATGEARLGTTAEAGLDTIGDTGLDTTAEAAPRVPGSATEPGTDVPGDGVAELGADAEAVADALAADADADPVVYDGYLAAEPPVAGYDQLSIPQLRGRLRTLTEAQVEQLVAYERANGARAPYLTMLENRLTTLRGN